jgi:hypothetical protein
MIKHGQGCEQKSRQFKVMSSPLLSFSFTTVPYGSDIGSLRYRCQNRKVITLQSYSTVLIPVSYIKIVFEDKSC